MTIVNEYEKIEKNESGNEISYTIREYDNGMKEKFLTGLPPMPYIPPLLTEMEQATLEMATNIEAMLALEELNLG